MRKPKQESEDKISIKGTKEGLVVTIGDGDWSELVDQLSRRLQHKAAFFDGARAILDAGGRELCAEDLRKIGDLFSANGMHMCGIRTNAPETVEAAAALQIPTGTAPEAPGLVVEFHPRREPEDALIVKTTVRSGQMLQHAGTVVIIGDVNPGAEVVASGDIIIWGKLRGTVHAGAQGDDSAIVCALSLAPTQLRIGSHVARPPEADEGNVGVPEIARVDEQGIIVEPWNATT